MTTDESQPSLELCGAPHPTLPGVTCQRRGKCAVDWHAAAAGEPPYRHWVEWGAAKPASGQPEHITGYHGWQPHGTTP